jgi:hypothetical protein
MKFVENLLPSKKEITGSDQDQTHEYLQKLVKRIGENNGYVATIEKHVFGGVGKIDVALESDGRKIACEISVTNDPEYEVQNIQKCLSAGYSPVIMISADVSHLQKIKHRSQKNLGEAQLAYVHFLEPEVFHGFLESLSDKSSADVLTKVKGYKVHVKYKESSVEEKREQNRTILTLLKDVDRRRESDG